MADNARVCWLEQSEPWDLESQLISQLDLPLNLDQNRHNAFHSRLKELRAHARLIGWRPRRRGGLSSAEAQQTRVDARTM
ncbi:hypothetical protein OG783_21540 [Streptomyces jietaisiensis]